MAITAQMARPSPDATVVELVADDFAEFVESYGGRVSSSGAFIAGTLEVEKGAEVDLICRMEDGFVLLRARCLVAWVRGQSDELGRRPGIGLHILRIDDGEQLIEKMVENQVVSGLPVFDVDRARPSEGGVAPSAERLHRMSERRGDRPELQALRSDKDDPVQELRADKSFAPGMTPRAPEPEVAVRATSEFRAPVPSGVARSLGEATSATSPSALAEGKASDASNPPAPAVLPKAEIGALAEPEEPEARSHELPAVEQQPEAPPEPPPEMVPEAEAEPELQAEREPEVQLRDGRSQSSGHIEVTEMPPDPSSDSLEELFRPRANPVVAAAEPPTPTTPVLESTASVAAPSASSQAGDRSDQLNVDPTVLKTHEWHTPSSASDSSDGTVGSPTIGRSRLLIVLGAALLLVPTAWLWTELPAEHRWSLESLAGRGEPLESSGEQFAVDASRATVCESVSYESGDDETRIVLTFDGALPPAALSDLRLDGSLPRHVFKMVGLSSSPLPLVQEVGSPQVRRLRFGLHRLGGEFRLHAVVDLEADATVVEHELVDDTLVLRVRS